MSSGDKFDAKKDQAIGEAKQKLGGATDNKDLKAEGTGQKKSGDVKSGTAKLKDAATDFLGKKKK